MAPAAAAVWAPLEDGALPRPEVAVANDGGGECGETPFETRLFRISLPCAAYLAVHKCRSFSLQVGAGEAVGSATGGRALGLRCR